MEALLPSLIFPSLPSFSFFLSFFFAFVALLPTDNIPSLTDLQALAQQVENTELTEEDIEKTLIPESKRQHKYTIKLWIEFSEKVLGIHLQEDAPFPEPPPANHIALFLTWYTRTSVGLINEKINDTTIKNRLRCLKRAIRLFTSHSYSRADNSQFTQLIKNDLLQTERLSTKAYNKPLAPINKDSNKGLLYRDVKLLWDEDEGKFVLHVHLRNRKGHRHNHKQGSKVFLDEDKGNRAMCPVTYFLALTLADGIFKGYKTLFDIQSKMPSPGSSIREFPYHGSISPIRILSYFGFHWMIRSLGERAGYKDKLTAYCFRRGYGNAIDKIATTAQRVQAMGHSDDHVFQAYLSSMIGIDSQNIIFGRDQRMDLINKHSSMMLHRNLLAPIPPRSQLAETSSPNTSQYDSDLPRDKRRYLQRKAFEEERRQFFQGGSTAPTRSIPMDGMRKPSRYLKALLESEADRHEAVMLMYPDIKPDGNALDQSDEVFESCETTGIMTSTPEPQGDCCVSLEQIVPPLQRIANGQKQNLNYLNAETLEKRKDKSTKLENLVRPHTEDKKVSSRPTVANELLWPTGDPGSSTPPPEQHRG
ncbi:hypothetical protein COCVIDRAFT_33313 [Bipolaris victoriae FI3]|uniref:Uncharacterized protein n=1 Tax=Bipolaris victoriae (strain FI3) TaxID=930091 RepID=W7EYR8_BIPV3|nr:hypothetical protein COCVIDRAFT_33313 [Bipolaris victoriae FI3]